MGTLARRSCARGWPLVVGLGSLGLLPTGVHAQGSASLDPRFGDAGRLRLALSATEDDRVEAVVVLPDGRIVAAGWVLRNGDSHSVVLRLLPDGRVDSTFGGRHADASIVSTPGVVALNAVVGGEEEKPRDLAIQRDGSIVVAGQVEVARAHTDGGGDQENEAPHAEEPTEFLLFRLTADGTLDGRFAKGGILRHRLTSGVDKIRHLLLLPDDRIVVVGHAGGELALVRFTADGRFDSTFGRGGVVTHRFPGEMQGRAVALLPDGALVAAGYARTGHGRGQPATTYLVRVASSGALDARWGARGVVQLDLGAHEVRAYAIVPTPDGGCFVGGRLRRLADDNADFFVARLDGQGRLDRSFGAGRGVVTVDFAGRDDTLRGLVLLPGGDILAAGFSLAGDDSEDFAVARLRPDGALDFSFGEGGRHRIDFGAGDDKLRGMALAPGPAAMLFGHAERGDRRDAVLVRLPLR